MKRTLLRDLDDPGCLIYGIGNLGRQDDGLGWAFVDWVEENRLCPQARLVRGYQLQLEDADLVSRVKAVLFVDSTKSEQVESFAFSSPEPRLDFSFTSHALSVESVLATSRQCFDYVPQCHLLAIRGFQWDLAVGLTAAARSNLAAVTRYLSPSLVYPQPRTAGAAHG
jgi:hydrogenase maturation protease